MQIIPTNTKVQTTDFLFVPVKGKQNASQFARLDNDVKNNANSANNAKHADFMDAVHEALEEVEEGTQVSVAAALADEAQSGRSAPLVQGPYSRNTTDGVLYTLDEVCFTKKELLELRAELLKAGAPEGALKKFDALAGQPDGATLAQVMAGLRDFATPETLDPQDIHNIQSLLGKIDPTGNLSDQSLALMLEGKGDKALALVREVFAALEKAGGIEISREESLSFGRGLGLDNGALQAIAGAFGGQDDARVTSALFSDLMIPARMQFDRQATQQQQINEALNKTLQPIVSKARARMEKEEAASALSSRKADRGKTRIDRAVRKNSDKTLEDTLKAGQHEDAAEQGETTSAATGKKTHSGAAVGSQAEPDKDFRASQKTQKTGSREPLAKQPDDVRSRFEQAGVRIDRLEVRPDSQTDGQTDNQTDGRNPDSGDKPKQDKATTANSPIQNKPNTPAAAPAQPGSAQPGSAQPGSAQAAHPSAGPDTPAADAPTPENKAALPRHAAIQVESALLTTLRDGATRMDLRLNPEELGAVTLTLTLRNGEVSARILSDKSETVEMLNSQLESIRINLEQQGIKVDKLEVQLNNDQRQNDPRQNLDQHNAWQENSSRREELARLKNLSTMRHLRENTTDAALEQPVQSLEHTAKYADQNFHLVA